jgi:hypothetical protein
MRLAPGLELLPAGQAAGGEGEWLEESGLRPGLDARAEVGAASLAVP